MLTDASMESIIKLFLLEVMCEKSYLKRQLLHVLFKDMLQLGGININYFRGLYISLSIVNSVHATDNTMRSTANTYSSEFKRSANSSSTAGVSSNSFGDGKQSSVSNTEAYRRWVDNVNMRFFNLDKYNGILVESPKLTEVRKSCLTYCTKKDFPRPDHVCLVSAIFKPLARNY